MRREDQAALELVAATGASASGDRGSDFLAARRCGIFAPGPGKTSTARESTGTSGTGHHRIEHMAAIPMTKQ